MSIEQAMVRVPNGVGCGGGWAVRTTGLGGAVEPTELLDAQASSTQSLPFNLTGYQRVGVQLTNLSSGSVVFQVSNDGTNWFPQDLADSSVMETPINTATANGLYVGAVCARYFRLDFTYGSHAVTASIVAS